MLLAQLTDTHILDPERGDEQMVDNNHRLALAVEAINAEHPRPEVVLATGDLTNNGHPGEMEQLEQLLAPLEVPLLALPGNHDDQEAFRATFDMAWADDHLSWVADLGELMIVGLDTTVPGQHPGLLDATREQWLQEALTETAGRPTAIAMHHPPFLSGLDAMDASTLGRADAFAKVVSSYDNIQRILCGHLHRPVVTTVSGVTTSSCLSTVHHVGLNLNPGAKIELIRDPAGYQLHRVSNGNWITHTRYIDTGEVAVVPAWAR